MEDRVNRLNSEMNACLLRCVISACNDNDHQIIEDLGLDSSLLERVKSMNADVFTRLTGYRFADVKVDSRRFKMLLDYAERERDIDSLINTMISLEASQSMLDKLAAGIDPRKLRSKRKILGLPPVPQGRPVDLDASQTDILNKFMKSNPRPTDDHIAVLKWYCNLGQSTGLALYRVWYHLVKYKW